MTVGGAPVIGIGEVLWDLLADGPRLGGAPCNVLVHLRRLGHPVALVSAVGADELGAAAIRELDSVGVDTSYLATVSSPTGRAEVVLAADGSPGFSIVPGGAFESVDLTAVDVTTLARLSPGAMVYGTLAQRSPTMARSTAEVAAALPDAIRLYDVNLRPGLWDPDLVGRLAAIATFVKMNRDEAAALAPFFDVPWPGTEKFCRALRRRLDLRGVAVTAGASGAAVLLGDDFVELPAVTVGVVDTIGSGDAFAAALVDGILAHRPAKAILLRSIVLGALVATGAGATPAWEASELAALEDEAEAEVPPL
jgi:fructokinase